MLNLLIFLELKFNHPHLYIMAPFLMLNLLENIVFEENFNNIKMFKNNLYIVNPSKNTKRIE